MITLTLNFVVTNIVTKGKSTLFLQKKIHEIRM